MSKVAAHVDVWCREVRLAWQDHYPGSLRVGEASHRTPASNTFDESIYGGQGEILVPPHTR